MGIVTNSIVSGELYDAMLFVVTSEFSVFIAVSVPRLGVRNVERLHHRASFSFYSGE